MTISSVSRERREGSARERKEGAGGSSAGEVLSAK